MTLEQIRARDAYLLTRFHAGESDKHPHGISGHRWIVDPKMTSNCRHYAEEWARAAGMELPDGTRHLRRA